MWEIPRYRIRAYLRSVKSSRGRTREQTASQRRIHFKRVYCELRTGDGFSNTTSIIPARAILNDLTVHGLRIFTPVALQPGQELAITIEHPRYFYVRAVVSYCHELPYDSRVLSQSPCNFRLGVNFVFASSAEEIAVENYCKLLYSEYLLQNYRAG